MSYQGCGCAGGEVVTMQSEIVPRDEGERGQACDIAILRIYCIGLQAAEISGSNVSGRYDAANQRLKSDDRFTSNIETVK